MHCPVSSCARLAQTTSPEPHPIHPCSNHIKDVHNITFSVGVGCATQSKGLPSCCVFCLPELARLQEPFIRHKVNPMSAVQTVGRSTETARHDCTAQKPPKVLLYFFIASPRTTAAAAVPQPSPPPTFHARADRKLTSQTIRSSSCPEEGSRKEQKQHVRSGVGNGKPFFKQSLGEILGSM